MLDGPQPGHQPTTWHLHATLADDWPRPATDLVAVDVAETKRARARELGAQEAVPPEQLDQRAQEVLDFVGSDATLDLAARTVEPGGAVVITCEVGGRLCYQFHALPSKPPDHLDLGVTQ
jgi:threonine dehydrogenase-like Zn-dependent dehydrogenase